MPETAHTLSTPVEALAYTPASGDWRIMTETGPATIDMQIEAGIRANGGSPDTFLNNLADNLPDGRRRDEKLAEKYPDRFGPDAHRHNSEQWDDWQRAAHSQRMAHATNGSFIGT